MYLSMPKVIVLKEFAARGTIVFLLSIDTTTGLFSGARAVWPRAVRENVTAAAKTAPEAPR
jgi:hypothetical protein